MPIWLNEKDVRAVTLPRRVAGCDGKRTRRLYERGGAAARTDSARAGRAFVLCADAALFAGQSVLGAKLVTVVPQNAARGLHTHLAVIPLFDPQTGELLAVMDGRYITEVRTAAVSAVSVRHLARNDAKVLAILGTGVQARSHLEALPQVRAFQEIRVWSPRWSMWAGSLLPLAEGSRRIERRGGRPRCGCRGGGDQFGDTAIEDGWVKAGAHVIAIGAVPAVAARGGSGR